MFTPKETKFKKAFKGKNVGNARAGYSLSFGSFGLKAIENQRIPSKQLEAARKSIVKHTERNGKMWIRVFPDIPVTKKAIGTRMECGKGKVEYFVCRVKPGKILFELEGLTKKIAYKALSAAKNKLNLKTKIIDECI